MKRYKHRIATLLITSLFSTLAIQPAYAGVGELQNARAINNATPAILPAVDSSSAEASIVASPVAAIAPPSALTTTDSTTTTPAATASTTAVPVTTAPNITIAVVNNIKPDDLWTRIRKGYAIPDLDNQYVTNQVNWYSTRTDYIKRTVDRGSRYLYHVVEELEKRGMPTELALLPFIESAFNPQAVSSAKASGMWQFMAATGHDYNLKQSMFKDDRRGVIDSTDAALTYLDRLHTQFGDWQLALAAYNWGEGSVQRAINRQLAKGLPIDFNSLSAQMPLETRNYVPKLQAVKNIIGNPAQYNIQLPELENHPYFVSIDKTRDIDVSVAAKLAELSIDEFTALNPQFNRPVITGDSSTKILLPTDNAALFKENLNKWEGPLSSWATHKVNKTEKLESLASRLGLKAELIREVNLIPAKMLVKAGSTILIPKSNKSPDLDIPEETAENAQLTMEKDAPPSHQISIKVGKRDNLLSIAKRYHVSVAQIKSWNKLKQDKIVSGQPLHLNVTSSQGQTKRIAAKSNKRGNTVARGNVKPIAHKVMAANAKNPHKPRG